MDIKLFDSELKVMEVLWEKGELTAKELARILGEQVGWNKNTTYTIIKKCVDKGAIERIEPNFLCKALIPKEMVQEYEINELIDKMFDGSTSMLFASLLDRQNLPQKVIDELKEMIKSKNYSD